MFISPNLFKKYISSFNKNDIKKLERLYTLKSGIEIEKHNYNASQNIVIGRIISIKSHPNANRLKICEVDIKNKIINIICGANNIKENNYVIVALENAILPSGIEIKPTKIREVMSYGMLCSLTELGFDYEYLGEDDKQGVLILNDNYEDKIGCRGLEYLNINYNNFEVSLTPNRSDLFSYRGLIYETAALLNKKTLNTAFDFKVRNNKLCSDVAQIKKILVDSECIFETYFIEFNKVNYKYTCDVIKFVLIEHRIKVTNTIQDVFKYISLMLGIHINVVDLKKISGSTIKIIEDCFNNKVNVNKIYIEDKEIGILGLEQRKEYKIDSSTNKILIYFSYVKNDYIQKISYETKIKNEEVDLLSKGVDPLVLKDSKNFIINLIDDVLPNSCCTNIIHYDNKKYKSKTIDIDISFINKTIGVDLSKEYICEILSRLNFNIKEEDDFLTITIPSYRFDIETKEDIVGEIIRIYGWENIPEILPVTNINISQMKISKFYSKIYEILNNLGFQEVITYLLISREKELLNKKNNNKSLKLLNPISSEREYIKSSGVSSIIEVLNFNRDNFIDKCFVYEISNTYTSNTSNQVLTLGGFGKYIIHNITGKNVILDFFVLKNIIEKILYFIPRENIKYERYTCEPFHGLHSCKILVNNIEIGFLGKLHPKINKKYKIKNDILVAELNLDLIKQIFDDLPTKFFKHLSKFPNINRDLTFIIENTHTYQDLITLIKKAKLNYCNKYYVKDVYKIKDNTNITIEFVFNGVDYTLKNETINQEMEKLISYMKDNNINIVK